MSTDNELTLVFNTPAERDRMALAIHRSGMVNSLDNEEGRMENCTVKNPPSDPVIEATQDLLAVLNRLGETADEVAHALEMEGVKGGRNRHSGQSNPVAQWVRESSGQVLRVFNLGTAAPINPYVNINRMVAEYCFQHPTDGYIILRVGPPYAINAFLRAFRKGEYPQLTTKE